MKTSLSNLKTSFTLRMAPLAMAFMLLFATTVVQPAQAQGIIATLKCATISVFASATITSLKISKAAMNTAFKLQLSVLQAAWQLEDSAISAVRSVGESVFKASVDAFAHRPGIFIKNTAYRTAALSEYRNTMLTALHNLETNIDAARAAYREDMLALIKTHQRILTRLVDALVTTIKNGLAAAKKNCNNNGVVVTLLAVLASANLNLFIEATKQDVKDLASAVKLVTKRNGVFLKEDANFVKISLQATVKLTVAFLTRK